MKYRNDVASIIDALYPGLATLSQNTRNDQYFLHWIWTAWNDDVDDLNETILQWMQGDELMIWMIQVHMMSKTMVKVITRCWYNYQLKTKFTLQGEVELCYFKVLWYYKYMNVHTNTQVYSEMNAMNKTTKIWNMKHKINKKKRREMQKEKEIKCI